MLFLLDWARFALATEGNDLWSWAQIYSRKLSSPLVLFLSFLFFGLFLQSHPADDYGTLVMAEALLEECLQENMDLLRSSTPLMDRNQPKLCRAKSHLNAILSRGRLTVSQAINSYCSCRSLSLKLVSFILNQVRVVLTPLTHRTLSIQIFSFMFCFSHCKPVISSCPAA